MGRRGTIFKEGDGLQLEAQDFILMLEQSSQIINGLFWKKQGRLDCGFREGQNTIAMKLYQRSVDNFPIRSKSSYNQKSIPLWNFRNLLPPPLQKKISYYQKL